jgi:hypothetical protein
VLIAGISFFFAPLPAFGLLLFILGKVINDLIFSWRNGPKISFLSHWKALRDYESLAGISIGMLSLIFYSTNLSAQSTGFGLTAPLPLYLLFLFLEGITVWLLLLPDYGRDWQWYLVGALLIIAPLIRVGASWDFMMRTTFPALYLLCVGCCFSLVKNKESNLRTALLISLLILGALTPIYEMNRSLVRTDRYYGYRLFPRSTTETYFQSPPATNQLFVPEFDHLHTLVANDWISVSLPNSVGWDTKVGNLFSHVFALLWDPSLIQK